MTGGTAPGSIKAFFKPTNLPATAGSGGTGGGKGGNCYRCGSSDHVRLSTEMGGLAGCALTVNWQCKLLQAPLAKLPSPVPPSAVVTRLPHRQVRAGAALNPTEHVMQLRASECAAFAV